MESEYHKIRKNVYESPSEGKKFLNKLFSEKGYIRVRIRKRGNKKTKVRNLRLIDKNANFIKNVQKLLKNQGIQSVIYSINNQTCLDIEGKQRLLDFLNIIGFEDENKTKQLQEALKPLSLSPHETEHEN